MLVTFLFIIFIVTFSSAFDPSISALKLYIYPSVPSTFSAVTFPFGFVVSTIVIDSIEDFNIFNTDFSVFPSLSVISIINSFSISGTSRLSTVSIVSPSLDLAISLPSLAFNTIFLVESNIVISNFACSSSGFINLVYTTTFNCSCGAKTSSFTLTLTSFLITIVYSISSPDSVCNVKVNVCVDFVKSNPSITHSVPSVGGIILYSFIPSVTFIILSDSNSNVTFNFPESSEPSTFITKSILKSSVFGCDSNLTSLLSTTNMSSTLNFLSSNITIVNSFSSFVTLFLAVNTVFPNSLAITFA